MCTVSMIMDHYREQWEPRTAPGWQQIIQSPLVPAPPAITPAEIEEFRRLLERAREYDKRNNEPDCELDEKRQALRRIAEELGVEISFL